MKLLIFDFDGTIVDSKAVYYSIITKHLKKYFSKKQIQEVIEIGTGLEGLLEKMGFSFLSRFLLKIRIMRDIKKQIKKIKKCKEVDSIKNLKARKIIVSNSYSRFIIPILKNLKLKKEFDEVYGAENFLDKAEFIKQYLKKKKISCKDCYYIGDRVADVEVAKEVGCKSIIVLGKCSWSSKKDILKAGPDFIVDSIDKIKEII